MAYVTPVAPVPRDMMVMKVLGTGRIGKKHRLVVTPIVDTLSVNEGDYIKFIETVDGHVIIQKIKS